MIYLKNKSEQKDNIFINIFDVCFIMVLCFITLFAAMLIQGSGAGIMHYHFKFATFIVTIGGLLIFLAYIIPQSERQLKFAFEQFYKDKK